MDVFNMKDCFTYIERMTKAEGKLEDLQHAYMQFKKQFDDSSIKGKKNADIFNAFMFAIGHILEVDEK